MVGLAALVACGGERESAPNGTSDELVNKQERCLVTGCSGQVCASEDVATDCSYREDYACYSAARCERQADGACGWTETEELRSCLEGFAGDAGSEPEPVNDCIVSGCSRQVCADRQVMTLCDYRAEYACYRDASCERQEDGACGWTQTDALRACLGR